MVGIVLSYTTLGIDAYQISVEADIGTGFNPMNIVGMASNAVKESKDRVIAAIKNSGYQISTQHYTINLAPADLKKDSAALDLPIALAILQCNEIFRIIDYDTIAMIGELSLDGFVRPVAGVLPIALAAKKDGINTLIVPLENAEEAAIIEGLNVIPVTSLRECVSWLCKETEIMAANVDREKIFQVLNDFPVDMSDVKGQFQVKRALEVAAAGGHNVLMIGPPGSGKTMLARRVPTILPELNLEEALEATKIHSVAGYSKNFRNGILTTRPFRSPHHTISDVALIGGGAFPKPGEVSLSHRGVLFLDELPEFKRVVLEVLRQPLEDGIVTISRAASSLTFPAEFMLIASMNPCPCGYFGSNIPNHQCNCEWGSILRYRSRISGPLLDRIDIHVEVPSVSYADLASLPTGDKSVDIRARVNKARAIQHDRFKGTGIFNNSQMNSKQLRKFCILDDASNALLQNAIDKMGYSARVFDRILKVSRTIADLEGRKDIISDDISEAIQYRTLDRKYWS
ncbi:MAG: YifB family Mg chelatase-like AAA ATPase [Candidatus Cloacimonadota bacterium]|jgi:magnesium chelatase family protein|nr:YifB family Mg chelatase-like AAA ATPase [Candidatus Cloacimonas sp.]MDI9572041.1 YifB family Mg chelatase-like AAA ATPase [Candidatus Cloacimonadota bacterium]MDY0218032.1 YifB family Mg chelatase-like AAA ATPase [Candidatus Cloacimonas acidaminovorans]HNZ88233.1 YifB family Mg chelatase-like AAA ATPase [Candidatus Cloacimonas acidaminovorans]HOE54649.1 YifB family Mg chelatase-like AAA ATPase [Candidatus Cloacimonas acidaminovorans]